MGEILPKLVNAPEYKSLGGAEVRSEKPSVDAGAVEGAGPAGIDIAFVEELVAPWSGEPAVRAKLLLELPGAPAGIAQSGDPARRPTPLRDGVEDTQSCGEHPAVGDLNAPLPAPIERMEDEAPLRL